MVAENNSKIYVIKRDGRKEEVYFDKITSRIQKLSYGLNKEFIDPPAITLKVIEGIYVGITTAELDNLAAQVASRMTTKHPDYAVLAGRIAVSNLHKDTKKAFSDVMTDLYNAHDPQAKKHVPMISEYHYGIIKKHANKLNAAIIYDRDYNYTYFGFKTLESLYLLKINGKVVERPQHMLMRVAVSIHGEDFESAIETYNMMSEKYFLHASTTLLNACAPKSQLSSSFSVTMKDDSIEGIFDTVKRCTVIAKYGGGVGLNIHCIRAKGSYISGTKGTSTGVIPMLRVYNSASRYIEFGMEKKVKAFSIYLEPWHSDIFEFLELSRSTGEEENRARDLDLALWVPDLFMERVERDEDWCLMCPKGSPGLSDCWGEEFNKLYTSYEAKGQYVKKVKARSIWFKIIAAQIENGTPYMVYKDSCNRKSNQQNLGTIKASNLSAEIVEYSSQDEIAVCNSASIALNAFVKPNKTYDFAKLNEVVKIVTRNLNRMIDINFYPLPETERSNKRHRPIGIGVQGLADAFTLMRLPFDSPRARDLNIRIFETLYYGALEASCELAAEFGPYETYAGSPVSKGILQYDMWNVKPTELWDWNALKEKIAKHGVRNSLLIALAPTTYTSQILDNSESFEPYASNVNVRRVPPEEFQVINHHLMYDLSELGLWNEDAKKRITANGGSIQNIPGIPDELKALYKTVWEIPQKVILQMAADRAPFVDQSQSLNVRIANPNTGNMSSMHFYGWKSGLKTGMCRLASQPTTSQTHPQKERFGSWASKKDVSNGLRSGGAVCYRDDKNKEECVACSA